VRINQSIKFTIVIAGYILAALCACAVSYLNVLFTQGAAAQLRLFCFFATRETQYNHARTHPLC
jgi:hypothetical protein